MYSRLYNEEPVYKRPDLLQAAVSGAEFLMKYAKLPNSHKCYLSVTRDGRPIKIQRSVFSECFYTLGMSELARATNEQKFKVWNLENLFYESAFTENIACAIKRIYHMT